MRAIVQTHYGPPDSLTMQEVERPVPGEDEVLVRVHAASINARDWHVMRGDPRIARWMDTKIFGRRGPKQPIHGVDFAGTVEAVGSGVRDLLPGEAVYGEAAAGAFADYVCAPRANLDRKPENLTFEQAAAVPLAAVTAITLLRHVTAGDRVLINGASGGVGTFAVQIAAAKGAEVTAVCSTRNVDLVRSIGAKHVVDYTRDDVVGRFDTVLDLVGNRRLKDLRGLLEPKGTLILSGGGTYEGGSFLGPLSLIVGGQIRGLFVKQSIRAPTAKPSSETLVELRDLIESGKVTPIIDRTYPLAETPAALEYLESEHARAKVVISVV
ncbi:NAD(P)-dependent alcohol dehydrogenase [Antrihabitans sp. YC3-6]|uniref:NAD(P)-dependent alcohol dehydrogenase n=1 Tax=Antrihabitans stalagmiti TaxID=2799499 RepID=A0A934NUU9_9NOCA|nr:NAD(P)-dependent alcohol dehydrogenase [Antrihabitans stalagmiti]MBJ8341951.1 NAD(P)-dependent alcohol dehydrogenase [Antrihabitans stalagmiti]